MSPMLIASGVAALAACFGLLKFGRRGERSSEFVAIGVVTLFVAGVALLIKGVVS